MDFYSLNKAEKLIYNFFTGKPKRLRFANGDKNINMAITQQRLSIKRNLLNEGLVKNKLFDFEILFGYVVRVLSIFTIATIFMHLQILSPKFQPKITDIIVDAFSEEVIFQEPEKSLKKYLINKIDFLKILGLGR